jgi:hypothetical protein
MAPQVVLSTPRPGPQRKDATVDSTRSVTVGDGILYAESGPPKYSPRAERALALYEERGHDIRRIGPETFEVPSCSGRGHYLVRYGGEQEQCSCPDRVIPCKHLLSVGIMHAARRSRIRVRTISVAGDPFKAAAKRKAPTAECAGCGGRFRRHDVVEVQESLTYFAGDLLCSECWHGSDAVVL